MAAVAWTEHSAPLSLRAQHSEDSAQNPHQQDKPCPDELHRFPLTLVQCTQNKKQPCKECSFRCTPDEPFALLLMAILIKVFAPMVEQWQEVLYWVIIASITIANLFALRQQNLKRLMAFSSISQAGYIMLGVISGSAQGMTSLVYYVLIYMFANLAVFTVITIVALRAGKFTLEDYNGLYTTNPKLAFLMTLALFSLAGIPPFAGFFSKFFIFAAAFEGGFHLLVFIALINTIISLYYYLKIVKAMYINKSDEPIAAFRSDNYTRASLAICTLGIVVLSIASVVYQSIDKFSFGL